MINLVMISAHLKSVLRMQVLFYSPINCSSQSPINCSINCSSRISIKLIYPPIFLRLFMTADKASPKLFRRSIIVVHSANRHILILRNCSVLSFSPKNRNHLISRSTSTKIQTDLLRVYVTNFLYVKVLRSHVLFKTQKVLEMFITKCKRTSFEAWVCCLFPCGLSSVDFCAKKRL